MAAQPLLLILAGPAGSGKSTLCDPARRGWNGLFAVITTTTRSPAKAEVNGVHYHFFSAEEFDTRAARGEFLEWPGAMAGSVTAP